ncbi:MAG: hypothetical protein K9I26_05870, partial [Flavobacterium sp.]|nr:hypothetical protein [Flavobacterium sp.]
MIKKLLLNNSKFFSIILMLLAFCGNVKSQTYTITGNRDAGTLSCGIFVGKNIISIGDGTETPSNLIMNDDLNLTLLGCSTNPLQIIVNNGTIDFSTANKRLYLPEGSSISLLNGGTLNPSGGNGGGCAGNDRIYIGGIILATCQGGAGIVSFEDIIAFEGSGSTISNSPVCVGNSINLSAIPPPKGSPYTYTWYEPSVSPNTSIGTGQNISIASATSGSHIYQVKMYSASLNKTMIANATVVVNSVTGPSAPAVTLTQPTCAVATGTITITTPVTGIQYSINGLTYTTTTTFSSLVSGVYSVTAKNSSGCISSATSTTINAQPTSPAGLSYTVASPSYCVGSLITTNSATLITAGSPAATYAVSPTLPAGLSLNITTGQITGTPTTAVASAGYTVTASNTSGCGTATSVVTITVNALPTAGLTSNDADNTFCAGTSVTFTATGGTSYNFRVGGTTVQNGSTTTYTTSTLTNGQVVDVIVTNASNCVATS